MKLSLDITRTVDRRIGWARSIGITADVVVRHYKDKDCTRSLGYMERVTCVEWTAASINKLAVALYATRFMLNGMLTWTDEEVRAGGGIYDQPGAPRHAMFFDVLYDMVARSGNTALVVIARHKVSEINGMLSGPRRGCTGTRANGLYGETCLVPKPDGFLETGQTSPGESLSILSELWKAEGPTAMIVREALCASRSHIPAAHGITVASKHGELNDDDGSEPFIRHEVGLITGLEPGVVGYSVFTRSPSHVKAKLSEHLIGQIGANLTELVGGTPTRLERVVGKSALTP